MATPTDQDRTKARQFIKKWGWERSQRTAALHEEHIPALAQHGADEREAAHRAGQESMTESEDARKVRLAKDREGMDRAIAATEELVTKEKVASYQAGQGDMKDQAWREMDLKWGPEASGLIWALPIKPPPSEEPADGK